MIIKHWNLHLRYHFRRCYAVLMRWCLLRCHHWSFWRTLPNYHQLLCILLVHHHRMLNHAWSNVTSNTIANCYHHAGFQLPTDNTHSDGEDEVDDDIPLCLLFQRNSRWDEIVSNAAKTVVIDGRDGGSSSSLSLSSLLWNVFIRYTTIAFNRMRGTSKVVNPRVVVFSEGHSSRENNLSRVDNQQPDRQRLTTEIPNFTRKWRRMRCHSVLYTNLEHVHSLWNG
jgi:hypothetical protein